MPSWHPHRRPRGQVLDQVDQRCEQLPQCLVLAETEDPVDLRSLIDGQLDPRGRHVAFDQLGEVDRRRLAFEVGRSLQLEDERVEEVEDDRAGAARHVRGRGGSAPGRSW